MGCQGSLAHTGGSACTRQVMTPRSFRCTGPSCAASALAPPPPPPVHRLARLKHDSAGGEEQPARSGASRVWLRVGGEERGRQGGEKTRTTSASAWLQPLVIRLRHNCHKPHKSELPKPPRRAAAARASPLPTPPPPVAREQAVPDAADQLRDGQGCKGGPLAHGRQPLVHVCRPVQRVAGGKARPLAAAIPWGSVRKPGGTPGSLAPQDSHPASAGSSQWRSQSPVHTFQLAARLGSEGLNSTRRMREFM